MMDTWRATLEDGSVFTEDSPELQVDNRSPFRELQSNYDINEIEAMLGLRIVNIESEGYDIVTGQAIHVMMPIGGGTPTKRRFRWVCRQQDDSWIWRITDGIGAWEIETTPQKKGREKMPRPQEGMS